MVFYCKEKFIQIYFQRQQNLNSGQLSADHGQRKSADPERQGPNVFEFLPENGKQKQIKEKGISNL
jgi:hypothetical protein